jgi:hypothetical protein
MHTLSLIIARPSLIFYLAQYGMATHVALAKVLCYFVLSPVLLLSLLVLARAVYTKLRDEYEMSGAMALVGVMCAAAAVYALFDMTMVRIVLQLGRMEHSFVQAVTPSYIDAGVFVLTSYAFGAYIVVLFVFLGMVRGEISDTITRWALRLFIIDMLIIAGVHLIAG